MVSNACLPSQGFNSEKDEDESSPFESIEVLSNECANNHAHSSPTLGQFEVPSSAEAADQPLQRLSITDIGRGESVTNSTGSTESSSRPELRRNVSGSKNRASVVPNTGRGRLRPTPLRRKSSQGKSQQQGNQTRRSQISLRSPTDQSASKDGRDGVGQPTDIPGKHGIKLTSKQADERV
jgi:hypothetical protein